MARSRFALLSVGLLLLAGTVAGCDTTGGTSAAPFDSIPIRVGFKDGRPGMSALNDGSWSGFEPHLAQRVLKDALGRTYTSVPLGVGTWKGALSNDKANNNTVNLVIADISEGKDSEGYDLAGPYLLTPLGVLLKDKDQTPVKDMNDLAPLTVCAQKDTTAAHTLDESHPQYSRATNLDECLKQLDRGTVRVVVADFVVLRGIAHNLRYPTDPADPAAPADPQDLGRPKYRAPRDVYLGRPQQLMAVLPPLHQQACKLLGRAIADYVQDTDWLTSVRTYAGLDDFTDQEIINTFRPPTTQAKDTCAA
ncbi:substrate-binding periplasmic protein [Kitasatospora sp. NPDC092948]|uniref:substrate-binding periplasmic protein n=1 Tax=Kitasatospora sp. NPDC092948 TaxID=3364088 RepID=UPI003813C426